MKKYELKQAGVVLVIGEVLEVSYENEKNFFNRLLKFNNHQFEYEQIVAVYNDTPNLENASGMIELRLKDSKLHGNHLLITYSIYDLDNAVAFVKDVRQKVEEVKNGTL